MQALNPLAVLHVALSPRYIFGLPSIDQEHIQSAAFQYLEHGNPVHSRRFHGYALNSTFGEPIGQGFQIASKRSKLADALLISTCGNAHPMLLGTNIDASRVRVDPFPVVIDGYFLLFLAAD